MKNKEIEEKYKKYSEWQRLKSIIFKLDSDSCFDFEDAVNMFNNKEIKKFSIEMLEYFKKEKEKLEKEL